MKYKIRIPLLFTIILSTITCMSVTAQSDESKSANEKLKEIKGNVEKITIETSDGATEFEGEEALYLMKKLKTKATRIKKIISKSEGDFKFFDEDSVSRLEKIKLIKMKDRNGTMIFSEDNGNDLVWSIDADSISDRIKKIEVELEDGEKTVTVTTYEDGEEKVETFTGDEADKFLEEHNEKSLHIFKKGKGKVFNIKKLGNKLECLDEANGKVMILEKSGNKDTVWFSDDEVVTMEVEVETDDSSKVVTIVTSEDGDENIEVFEGEDAEKWLDEHSNDEFEINFSGDDAHLIKVKKVKNISDDEVFEWTDKNDETGVQKTIKYSTEDDVKKLTIITLENGEEKTETYEGEEAETKFKELMKEHEIKTKFIDRDRIKKIIIK